MVVVVIRSGDGTFTLVDDDNDGDGYDREAQQRVHYIRSREMTEYPAQKCSSTHPHHATTH